MEEEINPNRPEEGRPPSKGEPAAEHSFDELAKGLANRSLSRGDALEWAGRALAGGLLASIPGIAWAQSSPQDPSGKGGGPESEQSPLQTSTTQASPQTSSRGCSPGLTKCPPNGCFDLSSDNNHCGTCTTVCPQYATCQSGQCQCPSYAQFTVCSGTCVILASNNINCGACGNVCTGGQICNGGS